MRKALSLVMVAVFLCGLSAPASGVPRQISFQGILTDPFGSPVTSPTSVIFSIWDAAILGDSLWSESQTVSPDTEGRFTVSLGSVSSIPDSALHNSTFLAIKVGTDPELSPRNELLSVPFSLRTGTVDSASGGTVVGNLRVDGDVTAENIQLTNGASTGEVLTAIDNAGNAAWAPLAVGGGNTLDESYDEGGPGAGRKIFADSGSVEISGFANHDALFVKDSATAGSNPRSMITALHNGTGPGIGVIQAGMGPGELISVGAAGNTSPGLGIFHAGIGAGIGISHTGTGAGEVITMFNPASTMEGLGVSHFGLGRGGNFFLSNAANPQPAVSGFTAGFGVGVRGESVLEDGVWGLSNTGGTWATSGVPVHINGGVHGVTPADAAGVDNFAVVGTADGYEGTGVLGIGNGERGHGVIGIPGGVDFPAHTQAGVWGMTRSEAPWPAFKAANPLTDVTASKKSQVAVLGQSFDHVAVWGESEVSVGVVGTTGGRRGLVDIPDMLEAGVYGLGKYDGNFGVYGKADSGWGVLGTSLSSEHVDAGVVGVGMGTAASAAALEIRNGAIRVTGPVKPAGVAIFPSPAGVWTEQFSGDFDCDSCVHKHRTGWTSSYTITNPLIDPARSMIFLTMFNDALALTGTVRSLAAGSAIVRVHLPRGDVIPAGLPPTVTIQYLVINE